MDKSAARGILDFHWNLCVHHTNHNLSNLAIPTVVDGLGLGREIEEARQLEAELELRVQNIRIKLNQLSKPFYSLGD